MRGIKECINWMIDNPMKELESKEYNKVRYYKEENKFEEYHWGQWIPLHHYLGIFDKYEWNIVIEPVDFETAKKDVEENKVQYQNKYGQTLRSNSNGNLIEIVLNKGDDVAIINTEWTKQAR